jgi:hypothetical protein
MDNQLTDMINSLLSNPQGLEAVSRLIKGENTSENQQQQMSVHTKNQSTELPDLNFLTNILGSNQNGVNALLKLKKAYDVYNNTYDPGINLINALSPYLSSKRVANANKIINAVKVSRVINSFREE